MKKWKCQAGLNFGDVTFEYSDEVENGHVISQDPKAGVKVNTGDKINVVISKGTEEEAGVAVPNVVGMDLDSAKGELIGSKLSVGSVKEEYSDKYGEGVVIRQGINAGNTVEEGTAVDLTVSKGKKEEEPIESPEPEPTLPSEEEPTEPSEEEPSEPTPVSKQQSISLPVGTEVKESYHVVVKLDLSNGQSQIVCDQTVPYENFPFSVTLTGTGTGNLYVSIDSQSYQEQISF